MHQKHALHGSTFQTQQLEVHGMRVVERPTPKGKFTHFGLNASYTCPLPSYAELEQVMRLILSSLSFKPIDEAEQQLHNFWCPKPKG
mmetsp:Transcript_54959/g.101734  ORF Transcript_54959/g.101734 Transcript_54959/m.101734 type:complete len:87 (+) Transcript_54959:2-262(+)